MTVQQATEILTKVVKGEEVEYEKRLEAIDLIVNKIKSDNHRLASQANVIERMRRSKG